MASIELRQLRAFGRSVTVGIAGIARDLDLLGIVEETPEALDVEIEKFRQLHHAARSYVEMAKAFPPTGEENLAELVSLFEQARQRVAEFYQANVVKRQAASDDPQRSTGDGIVDGYDMLLGEVASLHNCLNGLAWVLGEHVADLSEVAPGEYTSADDLFRAIGV